MSDHPGSFLRCRLPRRSLSLPRRSLATLPISGDPCLLRISGDPHVLDQRGATPFPLFGMALPTMLASSDRLMTVSPGGILRRGTQGIAKRSVGSAAPRSLALPTMLASDAAS